MQKTILIIDDDSHLRQMMKAMLEREGYSIIDAPDGKIGLDLFRAHKPDMVVTDLIMPEKEGIETIRELKKEQPDVKIIAISGGGAVAPEEYLHVAERIGVNRTLTKPFKRDEIITAVRELIG